MTKVEIHVLRAGEDLCSNAYIKGLLKSRSRYARVSLCVDTEEDVAHWRESLASLSSIEVFNQSGNTPSIPFDGEMLVTLSSSVSPVFSAFKQTIDIVTDSETAREDGRERYRFYRDRGYPLRHIKVEQTEQLV